jgi:hypothetical protein
MTNKSEPIGEDPMKKMLRLLAVSVVSLAMLASVFLPAMASEQQSQPANSVVSATGWHGPLVARVQVWSLRIRSCPSISCRQVGSLRYGTRVHIFNKAGGWSSIAPGMWVASYLLRS